MFSQFCFNSLEICLILSIVSDGSERGGQLEGVVMVNGDKKLDMNRGAGGNTFCSLISYIYSILI